MGPQDPRGNALRYLRTVVVRLAEHFAEVIPLALHVMTHPSFDPASLARAQPMVLTVLQEGLAKRLAALAERGEFPQASAAVAAQLFVSLAHDWALRRVHGAFPLDVRDLKEMVNVVWKGLHGRDD